MAADSRRLGKPGRMQARRRHEDGLRGTQHYAAAGSRRPLFFSGFGRISAPRDPRMVKESGRRIPAGRTRGRPLANPGEKAEKMAGFLWVFAAKRGGRRQAGWLPPGVAVAAGRKSADDGPDRDQARPGQAGRGSAGPGSCWGHADLVRAGRVHERAGSGQFWREATGGMRFREDLSHSLHVFVGCRRWGRPGRWHGRVPGLWSDARGSTAP